MKIQQHHISVQNLSSFLQDINAKHSPIYLRGNGSLINNQFLEFFIDNKCKENKGKLNILKISDNKKIIEHFYSDSVVEVEAGISIAELNRIVSRHNQYFPYEGNPEHSLAGVIARGNLGHSQIFNSGLRSLILGIRMYDLKGNKLDFGGKVVKNVAGYDVSRLVLGSMGTLGIISKVFVKLLPIPKKILTIKIILKNSSTIECLKSMQFLKNKFLPISALSMIDKDIYVRLSSNDAAVEYAYEYLRGKLNSELQQHNIVNNNTKIEVIEFKMTQETENFWQDSYFDSYHKNTRQYLVKIVSNNPASKLQENTIRVDAAGCIRWVLKNQKNDEQIINNINKVVQELANQNDINCAVMLEKFIYSKKPKLLVAQAKLIKEIFDPHHILNPCIFAKMYHY